MRANQVLSSLRKRTRAFKKCGYDLPASRNYIFWKCGFRKGTVLEIGSGKGHLTACLAKKGLKIISLDLDPESLRTARMHLAAMKLSKYAIFRRMNAEKLLFPSQSFDQVISVDFFHHAKDPVRCLKEMMRVTRKTLVIADLNKKGMRIMDRVHRSEGKKHEASRISFEDLKSHLVKNGFIVKRYRHICHQIFITQRRSL